MNLSPNTVWHHATVTRQRREAQNGHRGATIWFTDLPGAGKSTTAREAIHQVFEEAKFFIEPR